MPWRRWWGSVPRRTHDEAGAVRRPRFRGARWIRQLPQGAPTSTSPIRSRISRRSGVRRTRLGLSRVYAGRRRRHRASRNTGPDRRHRGAAARFRRSADARDHADDFDAPAHPATVRALAGDTTYLAGTTRYAAGDHLLPQLGAGERAAIFLLRPNGRADLILMDDRAGVVVARSLGFFVDVVSLGILELAARHELIDLASAFARLRTTNFDIARS